MIIYKNMALSIGIVGLPNVGKSTLFKTLTKKQVDIENYPFCTIEPNVGIVAVPDERVDKLGEMAKSKKKIYATVEFVDIAGLVKGANKGEGLGNKFLANIRETDAIVYVLRGFKDSKVINTENAVNPLREKEILDVELILKDLETVIKRIEGLEGDIRAGKKEAVKEREVLEKVKAYLTEEKILADQYFSEEELKILKNYQLLTMKPRLYLLNASKDDVSFDVLKVFDENNWKYIIVDVLTESEAEEFTSEERVSFGLEKESETDILIKKSYEILGLITFFTTGEDETRAWTIKRGALAPIAGGVIHSDFEKNFIKAEVISSEQLLKAEGFSKAREQGLIRTEGKEYVVNDGDVIEIKHG